ncbi:MAG: hypothetical protein L3J35_03995 [Bacteroidales bacterium]|nr:hypothetical protein [Bacteroidales bacterium]
MKSKTLSLFSKIMIIAVFGLLNNTNLFAQAVSINSTGAAPDASAILDITSTNSGILIPRMTEAQRGTIDLTGSPVGILVYQTDGAVPGFYYYNGTDWQNLFGGSVPVVPGNTEYWLRPAADPTYIYPEGNDMIKVYDSGQTYGIFYDGGLNQYGLYGRTTNVTDPTAAVVGFSDVLGNQTYGYLGFDGTYDSGTGLTLNGTAVYGWVEDANRTAGFFRTTTNATVAASINYSDVWIASFNQVDNTSSVYNPSGGYYQLDNTVDPSSAVYQRALMTLSTSSCPGNVGVTNGGYIQAFGGNQDSYGVVGVGSSTGTGIGVYGNGSWVGVYSSSGGAFKGNNFGIGLVSKGDLYGGLLKGSIYGVHISGTEYAAYIDGIQYSNNIIVQLNDNKSGTRTATYVPVSETVDIILKGKGELINGKSIVNFDKNIVSLVSEKEPIYITVTPTSTTQGIYIASTKSTGFEVVENNNGKSDATFNWIAIATRKGYENIVLDKAVIDSEFDNNFGGVYRDILDKQNPPTEIMWNGTELKFGEIPKYIKVEKNNYIESKYKIKQNFNKK